MQKNQDHMETHFVTIEKEHTHVVQNLQSSLATIEVPFWTTGTIAHSWAGDSSSKKFSTSLSREEL